VGIGETAKAEIERLEEDVLYTEKAHFSAAATLQKVHIRLGVFGTVAAAASAATILAESSPWVSGLLALVASISTAILTFVKPEERATQHLQAGRALGALRVRMRQFRSLHNLDGMDPQEVRESVVSLSQEKATVDAGAPAVSDRAFKSGRRAIDKGLFKHDADN
jgi:hypothetical protein